MKSHAEKVQEFLEIQDHFRDTVVGPIIMNELFFEKDSFLIEFFQWRTDLHDADKICVIHIYQNKISIKLATEIYKSIVENKYYSFGNFYENNKERFQIENIRPIVRTIMEENPALVQQIKEGKSNLLGFLVGQCLKRDKNLDPKFISQILKEEVYDPVCPQ